MSKTRNTCRGVSLILKSKIAPLTPCHREAGASGFCERHGENSELQEALLKLLRPDWREIVRGHAPEAPSAPVSEPKARRRATPTPPRPSGQALAEASRSVGFVQSIPTAPKITSKRFEMPKVTPSAPMARFEPPKPVVIPPRPVPAPAPIPPAPPIKSRGRYTRPVEPIVPVTPSSPKPIIGGDFGAFSGLK
jgi:hypothetical protein